MAATRAAVSKYSWKATILPSFSVKACAQDS